MFSFSITSSSFSSPSLAAQIALAVLDARKVPRELQARLGISLFPLSLPKRTRGDLDPRRFDGGDPRYHPSFSPDQTKLIHDAAVVISTTTETGQAEAKRSMPEADAHFLPSFRFLLGHPAARQAHPTRNAHPL